MIIKSIEEILKEQNVSQDIIEAIITSAKIEAGFLKSDEESIINAIYMRYKIEGDLKWRKKKI